MKVTRSLALPRYQVRPVVIAALLLALALAVLGVPAAQAAFSGCRADPVFLLSDGTILDVQVDIGTNVKNVDEIHYTVHGPRGVKLIAAISTPTLGFEGLETVTYIDDGAAGKFVTDTIVHTSVANVSTSSYTVFAGNSLLLLQLKITAQYKVIKGWAGQHLIAYLSK